MGRIVWGKNLFLVKTLRNIFKKTPEGKEQEFSQELIKLIETGDDLNDAKNKELGQKFGHNIEQLDDLIFGEERSHESVAAHTGYDDGYNPDRNGGVFTEFGKTFAEFQRGTGSPYGVGLGRGKRDRAEGKMNKLDPQVKGSKAYNFIKTNTSPRRAHYFYSNRPIPLIIENN